VCSFVVVGACVLGGIKGRWPKSNVSGLGVCVLAVLDVVTDVLFAISLADEPDLAVRITCCAYDVLQQLCCLCGVYCGTRVDKRSCFVLDCDWRSQKSEFFCLHGEIYFLLHVRDVFRFYFDASNFSFDQLSPMSKS